MKYSKGKWTRKIGKFFDVMIAVEDENLYKSGYIHDSNLICDEVYSKDSPEETEGNISLIINSPRMYELLKEMVEWDLEGGLSKEECVKIEELLSKIENDK